MKHKIKSLINSALTGAYNNGDLNSPETDEALPEVLIEEPKVETQGDYSTNIAMILASIQKMAPQKIAKAILRNINDHDSFFDKIEIAGPGFINFFINKAAWYPILKEIHHMDLEYGAENIGKGKKIQVEFVSANPTGPLHVGHGRGAAVGDSIANILNFCGFNVEKEYYINDSGRQINTLGRSVFFRYKELFGKDIVFPEDCYQGMYIVELAENIKSINGDNFLNIEEETAVNNCARFAAEKILAEIKEALESFGVQFDNWFSEQSIFDSGKVAKAIENFQNKKIIYNKEGALWFKTSDFGDEKDRVVVRNNGLTTYFASDIAYHQDKFNRGFERIIDIWGADHHGYIPRIAASIEASGVNRNRFDVILIQLVNLLRDGLPVAMSTRAGEFVTLNEVINEVGRDAARFIFLTRNSDSPLDFDLELAKKKTNDNPVYYVQYVHARISSIIRKGKENGVADINWNAEAVNMLKEPEEIDLLKSMNRFPAIVKQSAMRLEPHRITFYLMNLASSFHAYYNKHRVLNDDPLLSCGRLYLVLAVKKIIRNGLGLLGVSAPEKM
ncbi:arginyl-tRNA synthetase [Desulfosarcina sp. BuS5]|uniref:arginine--tRNA ligase n=1 Tax=Desulfosarcina sp. BuS5 TaxID=933262 RepID=UPI0004852119|nr:arginine--tRNA ligase [Desulfosarcina sp. BuS5]WDN90810.1 arginyl-tRNA synthetase [Desulfosarcina sp. BuS5]